MQKLLVFFCSFILILSSGCVENVHQGDVIKIVDGDTVDINVSSGTTERIRLLCVDTPEKFSKNNLDEYCCVDSCISNLTFLKEKAEEASDFANKELYNKNVTVLGNEKDKYGRTLALLEVDGKDFSRDLIIKGLARYTKEYYCPRAEEYAALEETAKNNRIGVWAGC